VQIMATSTRDNALDALNAAVAGHRSGGEVRMQLQPDWSDGAVLPTIVVRIGNHVTVRQAGTYHDAAEAMLTWVSRQAESYGG
jgi:hypothetical protein